MEAYNNSEIKLNEKDLLEALLYAYKKKKDQIEHNKYLERLHQNRAAYTQQWSVNIIDSYMRTRAKNIFDYDFNFELPQIKPIYDLLCLYFTDDKNFYKTKLVVNEPSLDKGILLIGGFGLGKTSIMKLFQKQIKQVYFVRESKYISDQYLKNNALIPDEFIHPFENEIVDNSVFMQKFAGLCIEDMGSENEKNSYGNKSNVIGDLIEERYRLKFFGKYLHGTTNLSASGLKEFYGERVTSRIKEMFNLVVLNGSDLRK